MELDLQTWVNVAAFCGGGLCMGLGAIGAAIGEGTAAQAANAATARNPDISGDIFKSLLVGQAVAESASIFALVVALILLFSKFPAESYLMVSVLFSAGIAMGIGAIGSGVGSGLPAAAACEGMARQPKAASALTTNMLIGSAVCQTPSIFALVTAFILLFSDFSLRPLAPTWAALLGAGIAAGLGSIGSGLGGGLIAQTSCEGIARKPDSASSMTNIMLLSQAVTQTTAIYALLIAFILMFKNVPASESLASAMALLGAGLCMGFGAIGPGVGEGFTGRLAVRWIARNEKAALEITRVMLVGQAVAESTGIYAMVISLVLIFVI